MQEFKGIINLDNNMNKDYINNFIDLLDNNINKINKIELFDIIDYDIDDDIDLELYGIKMNENYFIDNFEGFTFPMSIFYNQDDNNFIYCFNIYDLYESDFNDSNLYIVCNKIKLYF